MKKLLFFLFSGFFIFLLSLSASAAVSTATPSFSHSVIEYRTEDASPTARFSFYNSSVTYQFSGENITEFDTLSLDLSKTDLVPWDPDSNSVFVDYFDVVFSVSGDPGFIAAFINGGTSYYPVKLMLPDLFGSSVYPLGAQINQYSLDEGETWSDFTQYSFRTLIAETDIKFHLRFSLQTSCPAHDFWCYIYYGSAGQTPTPVNEFTVTIDSAFFQVGTDDQTVVDILTPPVDGDGFESFFIQLFSSLERFDSVSQYFLDQFNAILSSISDGARSLFDMYINPLDQIVINVGGLQLPIVVVFLTVFLIVFIVAILRRILG